MTSSLIKENENEKITHEEVKNNTRDHCTQIVKVLNAENITVTAKTKWRECAEPNVIIIESYYVSIYYSKVVHSPYILGYTLPHNESKNSSRSSLSSSPLS